MTIKPILFNSEMVQAILAGRKTQTRRVVKQQPDEDYYYEIKLQDGILTIDYNAGDMNSQIVSPYGKPGDILWVRETWRKIQECNSEETIIQYAADKPDSLYLVDGDGFQMFNKNGTEKLVSWKPSIHMPKEAARIFLKVKDVRVERLQVVSEEDAIAEGVEIKSSTLSGQNVFRNYIEDEIIGFVAPENSFASLWQSIYGPESWNQNPYVWVYTFEVVEKPENFLAQ